MDCATTNRPRTQITDNLPALAWPYTPMNLPDILSQKRTAILEQWRGLIVPGIHRPECKDCAKLRKKLASMEQSIISACERTGCKSFNASGLAAEVLGLRARLAKLAEFVDHVRKARDGYDAADDKDKASGEIMRAERALIDTMLEEVRG